MKENILSFGRETKETFPPRIPKLKDQTRRPRRWWSLSYFILFGFKLLQISRASRKQKLKWGRENRLFHSRKSTSWISHPFAFSLLIVSIYYSAIKTDRDVLSSKGCVPLLSSVLFLSSPIDFSLLDSP